MELIKINNMFKKSALILFFLMLTLTGRVYSAGENFYAGTPAGFYDDIDPNSLEEENNPAKSDYETENEAFPRVYEDSDIVITPSSSVKATKDYTSIYNALEPADFSYLHNIDPDEYYDDKDAAWSVYPLLRLNSEIFFKNITIEPGYYLLTPREHNGKWYMLFKQNGTVKYIIPAYDRDYTPETFYDSHIPKPKLTPSQKVHMGILNTIGKAKSSKRKAPIKSYLEVNDLDNYFLSIIIYFGNHKYSTLFRTIRL